MSKLDYTVFSSTELVNHIDTFPDPVAYDDQWIHEQVYVHEIDRRNLINQRTCMADFTSQLETVLKSNCQQIPIATAKALYALQSAVYNCEVMEEPSQSQSQQPQQQQQPQAQQDVEDEVPPNAQEATQGGGSSGEREPKRGRFKKEKTFKNTFETVNGVHERVSEYVETVRSDDDAVLGWRIWYIVNDTKFNFDRQLNSVFESQAQQINQVQRGKRLEKTTQMLWTTSQTNWIQDVLEPLAKEPDVEDLFNRPDELVKMRHYKLWDTRNKARTCNLLGGFSLFRRSIFQGLAANEYMNDEEYFKPNAIFFPHGAIRVSAEERHPDFFHHVILLENAITRIQLTNLAPPHQRLCIRERAIAVCAAKALHSEGNTDLLKQISQANAADLEVLNHQLREAERFWAKRESLGLVEDRLVMDSVLEVIRVKTVEKIRLWRRSAEMKERMNILITARDSLDPGYLACNHYMAELQTQAARAGKPFSIMRVKENSLDPTLSTFARMMADMMFQLETVFGIAFMHLETMFLMVNRLGVFHHDPDRMRNHIIFYGPAQTSKSFIVKVVKKCSLPMFYVDITHESSKTYACDTNQNKLMFCHDELSEKHIQDDDKNQGDSMFKTMLTEKVVKSKRLVKLENGTWEMKEYTAYMDIMMVALSNANKKDLSGPIVSRFIMWQCVKVDRKDFEWSLKEAELEAVTRDSTLKSELMEFYRLQQCVIGQVEMMIATYALPPLDMSAANMYMSMIISGMAKHSITIDPRALLQAEALIRDAAIMEAHYRVYCTKQVFKEDNKPFDVSDYLAMEPYLFATEQHVIYAMTSLQDVLMDPTLETVINALTEMTLDETHRVFMTSGTDKEKGTTTDKNYLFIPTANTQPEYIIDKLTSKVAKHILAKERRTVMDSSIKTVLQWMNGEYTTFDYHYDDNDKHVNGTVSHMPLLKIETAIGAVGVGISRQYLEKARAKGHISALTSVLDSLRTKHTEKRLMVTGQSFRKPDAVYPHLLRTMNFGPDLEKESQVRNLAFRPSGFGLVNYGKALEGEGEDRYIKIDTSIEQHRYAEFMKRNGISTKPDHFPADLSGEEKLKASNMHRLYPEAYQLMYDKENINPNAPKPPAAPVPAAPVPAAPVQAPVDQAKSAPIHPAYMSMEEEEEEEMKENCR